MQYLLQTAGEYTLKMAAVRQSVREYSVAVRRRIQLYTDHLGTYCKRTLL
jgi:hypothetical protein